MPFVFKHVRRPKRALSERRARRRSQPWDGGPRGSKLAEKGTGCGSGSGDEGGNASRRGSAHSGAAAGMAGSRREDESSVLWPRQMRSRQTTSASFCCDKDAVGAACGTSLETATNALAGTCAGAAKAVCAIPNKGSATISRIETASRCRYLGEIRSTGSMCSFAKIAGQLKQLLHACNLDLNSGCRHEKSNSKLGNSVMLSHRRRRHRSNKVTIGHA